MSQFRDVMAHQLSESGVTDVKGGGLGKVAGGAAKAGKAVPKPIPKSAPPPKADPGRTPGDHNLLLETEAILNGTPMSPIGTGRRVIFDGLNAMSRKQKQEKENQNKIQKTPPHGEE